MAPPLVVAVPELHSYDQHSGIGRVFHSLREAWDRRVQVVNARFARAPLPLLRNLPFAVRPQTQADLVLLPRLTGAQALRRTGGLPAIAVVHDIGVVDFDLDRPFRDPLTHLAVLQSFRGLRHATKIVAVSHFTAGRLVHHSPELAGRIHVVPNGVDWHFLQHSRTREVARERLRRLVQLAAGAPLLLYVGTETPRKNVALLLETLQQLKARFPALQLLKVGQAGGAQWRRQTLEQLGRLGLRAGVDVLFLEDIDDHTLADVYKAADLFVSPSLYEGCGLPALEALAVGAPVVVSNRGALPEVVGHVGQVVPPTVPAFAAAIVAALAAGRHDGRERERRAWAGRFTWGRAADGYLEVMQRTAPR